ncbi:MAG: DUF1223 domain-containing protein [Terracidiphilus sp.]
MILALGMLSLAVLAMPRSAVITADESAHRPVLVELFTSEGCSSCPPADALLACLDAQRVVGGAQVIVLSEHVTYWDRPEWRDAFSLQSVTDRQQDYGNRFRLDSVYTPEAVVDGEAQMTGSDGTALLRAIAQAAATPAFDLAIEDAQWSGNAVHFKVHAGAASTAPPNATLTAALADDLAQASIGGGENAGRTLRYVAVVRAMKNLGNGTFDGRQLELKTSDAGKSGPIRLVVFLTDPRSGHVLGAAEQTLSR